MKEHSGLMPLDPKRSPNILSAEGLVTVEWEVVYRCALCGWTPGEHWGCVSAMEEHLIEKHGMPTGTYWLSGYRTSTIRKALTLFETAKQLTA